jgi:hypothetical protein
MSGNVAGGAVPQTRQPFDSTELARSSCGSLPAEYCELKGTAIVGSLCNQKAVESGAMKVPESSA